MNRELYNFLLFPHLPERRNKGNHRYPQQPTWVTELLDCLDLPDRLLAAAEKAQLCLRDQVIVRLVCDSGARSTEIIQLSIGEWRTRGYQQEVLIDYKGRRDRRARLLHFSSVTAKLLLSYINGERKQYDLQHRELTLLADTDPLFLSKRQRRYTYKAFLPHWRQLCQVAGLSFPLRGLRTWYVLQQLRIIHEHTSSFTEIDHLKDNLVKYMGWSSSRPLHVYEHYIHMKQDEEEQFQLLNLLQ